MKLAHCNDLSANPSSRKTPARFLKRLWVSYVRSCERAYGNLPPYSLW